MPAETRKYKALIAQRDLDMLKINDLKNVADDALNNKALHNLFKCRHKHIDIIQESYAETHNAIIHYLISQDDTDLDPHVQMHKEFDTIYYHIEAVFMSLFEKAADPNEPATPTRQNKVKLPKIEIPSFDGNFKNWQTFIDMYDSLIHNNSSLSNIEKFNYLISYLKGTPLNLVKCTPLSGQNYLVAYNTLKTRYDNKRLISMSHWQALKLTKRLQSSENSSAIRLLTDTFNENISALEIIGYPVEQWDFIIFNMLIDKLDHSTVTRFELECGKDLEDPTNFNKSLKILLTFLNKQCQALDTVSFTNSVKSFEGDKLKDVKVFSGAQKSFKPKPISSFVSVNPKLTCQLCSKDHFIYNCPDFVSLDPKTRFNLIKTRKWCTNCLGTRHAAINCISRNCCRICSRKHHTMLHFEHSTPSITQPITQNNIPSDTPVAVSFDSPSTNLFSNIKDTIILSTALINILDLHGNYHVVRAVLDSASQSSFISQSCCSRLNLSPYSLSLDVKGIGGVSSHVTQAVSSTVKPISKTEPLFSLEFIVLPEICGNLPITTLSSEKFSRFSHLKLADPQFNVARSVDVLLGAEIFGLLLKGNSISRPHQQLVALETIFGWVVMGRLETSSPVVTPSISSSFFTSVECSLDTSVKRFWELEEIPTSSMLSLEESQAEKCYTNTVSRTSSGKYLISLPFRETELTPTFEGTRDIALRRFFALEKRLRRNPSLHNQYCEFMQDYLNLNHMTLINDLTLNTHCYYLPHHCIFKADSPTTKLRVVFDGSCLDINKRSLNDTLLPGPKLQQDICSILIRFRCNLIAFTADIKQMFRQILVSEEHTHYQRILWRFSPLEQIRDYRLLTVTFGLNCSPFLAIRTLLEIAKRCNKEHPEVSDLLENSTYVDDIVSGCDSLSFALKLQKDIISVLEASGFELRKWASNSPLFLSSLPTSVLQEEPLSFDLDENCIKILGLHWNPSKDNFYYKVVISEKSCTKRNLLSELAKIYDPLGFLVPITFTLKLIIQNLWKSGINWDARPPSNIINIWSQIRSELPLLATLQIPRYILNKNIKRMELHGFCDASEKGYAAVVYIRHLSKDNTINTSLVIAKSKIAPIKKISIPRLELCGALLLAKLLKYSLNVFSSTINFSNTFAWCDSTIVLYWLKGEPHRWNTFICNRVTQILENIPLSAWHHVKSEDNPADVASRGLLPSGLVKNISWWAGPLWLRLPRENWPPLISLIPETQEEQRKVVLSAINEYSFINWLFQKFSALSTIVRIVCYILRFVYNCRHSDNRQILPISSAQFENALHMIIKDVQSQTFSHEIVTLKEKGRLPKFIKKLSPFLDEKNILRVGGRLAHSNLRYTERHPILLPSNHKITELLIEYTHKIYLHPGLQTMQYILSQKYWILSPKRTIRRVLSHCHKCFRANPPVASPPTMGNLPAVRIAQIKPFSAVGVDYGGPFVISMYRTRGCKTFKAYICLFVCMATKAIHLELVSELTSEAFLAALRRFIARRGRCNEIYSDCGTNFVGASKEINKMLHSAAEQEMIRWHFIPPSAPNFGGLWEAGIKAVKTHLKRVIGDQILTYEEFYTLLVQIEAVLNSRPLCPQSSDPNDLHVLTPGHFLTLEPLNAPPEYDFTNVSMKRLSRWQLLQSLHQQFWRRWKQEYLHTLLQKGKWLNPSKEIPINSIVLLKEDNLPPSKWSYGRVINTHPGADGIARVVTLKTANGSLKRPVTKVCPLPTY